MAQDVLPRRRESGRWGRRWRPRRVAAELFAVEKMARRTLSRHWARRTPGERAEFVALFAAVLARAYVTRLGTYAGERVVFGDAVVDGPYALVPTRVVRAPGGRPRWTTCGWGTGGGACTTC